MINQILLAIWKKLTLFIEGALDPEWKAKAENIERREKELDEKHKALETEELAFNTRLAESVKKNAEMQAKLDEINSSLDVKEQTLAELRRQDKEIDDALAKAKTDIAGKTDAEKVRLDV